MLHHGRDFRLERVELLGVPPLLLNFRSLRSAPFTV